MRRRSSSSRSATAECRELISNLLDRAPLPPDAESRIADAAEGNALFAEELVAMLVDDELLTREDGRWVASSDLSELPVPSTIHALLAARLEGLPADERAILTAAAVEGRCFTGAPSASSLPTRSRRARARPAGARPPGPDPPGLRRLRRRGGLPLPSRPDPRRRLPLAAEGTRADLHERFAAWLELTAGDRLREFEEIVGYHLEQAFRYRVALGSLDSRAASLATRASERLEAAGRRALVRSDLPAAIGLLERAAAAAPDAPRRAALLAELGAALIEAAG